MNNKVITIFGAGFIGKSLIFELLRKGYIVNAISRNPYLRGNLRSMANIGQLEIKYGDITKKDTIEHYFQNADIVINLVGVLAENSKNKYRDAHVIGPKNLGELSKKYDIKRLIHISSIGADTQSNINYQKTKGEGEEVIKYNFSDVSIIRPSIVFGPEDGFFNLFAGLARFTFFLPVFGCPALPKINFFTGGRVFKFDFYGNGGTKFQPVYVGDVADAICAAIDNKKSNGQVFEVGGPSVYSSVDIMNLILRHIGRKRLLIPIPFWYLKIVGWLLQKFPAPLLTYDQVMQLKIDNVVSQKTKKLSDLGVNATPVESILPQYLTRFKKAGH